ncbi:MAG: hypothetical protein K6U04_03725 [Armatimonadetes bacterium]|nr:hypothetical protein [Armatimonadota bacterium]
MANTTYLRKNVEEYVRKELAREFGIAFKPRLLTLITGGKHEFDAVSDDGTIVASIKTAGGKTARGRVPSGKIKNAEAELYYLTLVSASKRLLVFTSQEFYQIMSARLEGRLAPGLSLKLVLLPRNMQEEIKRIQRVASNEVSKLR